MRVVNTVAKNTVDRLLGVCRPSRTTAIAVACSLMLLCGTSLCVAGDVDPFEKIGEEYSKNTLPLITRYCLDCHSTDAREGELDLQRFTTFDDIRRDPPTWQKVDKMLANGEMPPEDNPRPNKEQRAALQGWVRRYLDTEALSSAGDPGPVVLRRLNNAEYTCTVRDLTGAELDPAREFPVDGAAGEGFTNTGNALVMSPSLVTKYLDAAKGIAAHAVFLSDGFRFSPSDSRRDWTNETLANIRDIYLRYTGRLGDSNSLNRWDVTDPTKLTNRDGRVDLKTYFTLLIENREQVIRNTDVARDIGLRAGLSPKYLHLLAQMLTENDPASLLLESLRDKWRSANVEDAATIASEVRTWQEQLWKFNPVGHFGQVKGWQELVTPLVTQQSFRVKFDETTDGDVAIYLMAGSAGDESDSEAVVWQAPRIERPGHPALLLRDLRATSVAFAEVRKEMLKHAAGYLSAAFDMRSGKANSDLEAIARAHEVNPEMLRPWLLYLGISYAGEATIKEYLRRQVEQVAGYDFVTGWTLLGATSLSLIANSSDEQVNIPGRMNPHKIAVHPQPERWIAAGWRSPIDGRFRLMPSVKDVHDACGNGVAWSFELRRDNYRRVLSSGTVDLGGIAETAPLEDISIRKGDLISLVISARDQNHVCDLTEIDLEIDELEGEHRRWSLSGDCADTVDASNPHADRLGNPDTWHFYTGLNTDGEQARTIPEGSLLAKWLVTGGAADAERIAAQFESLVNNPLPEDCSAADVQLQGLLTSWDGPLFSQVDTAALAKTVSDDAIAKSGYGINPHLFGQNQDGSAIAPEHLVVSVPSVIKVVVPKEFASEGEFVVTGTLSDTENQQGSVQLAVTRIAPSPTDKLMPGVPVVVNPGTVAEARFQDAFDGFQELFPEAMCYPRIVPVDVVVTLVLFYREDHHLSRLMLSEGEAARLDRLWDELHYINQDALTIVSAFEQLLEFATQDDDPKKYEPLGKAIYQQADAFRQRLIETEGNHMTALLEFASRAYRRPLSEDEVNGIHQLYAKLRSDELSHDESLRLTMARVLAAPAFLYHLETPAQGESRSPVSNWELASRLSYFLWSSLPDANLRAAADSGDLSNPQTLLSQARRMLHDKRMRRMAIEFACQWIHVRNFDLRSEKNERQFPTFAELRDDMYEETVRFFTDLFQNDGSILSILDADHTFLNETLANHYGIPGVSGEQWRRVDGMRAYDRGGILAQATILAEQSGASRTSPILRGNWVSETLLGERLPRPPKNVPQLPESVPPGLSERQLIERHSSDVACAKCHARMDPYGFALESFDAIGRYRAQDAAGHAIDTKSTLADGETIEGIAGLRTYLLTVRREVFVRHFCRKLLGYALARGVQLSDEPLLDEMMAQLAENEYRFSTALEKIIMSDQFRMIRGRQFSDGVLTRTHDDGVDTQ